MALGDVLVNIAMSGVVVLLIIYAVIAMRDDRPGKPKDRDRRRGW